MKKDINIYDIAKTAGVSITTVSRAINSPNMLKPSTREKIFNIIRDMEYTPNALAQGLVLKSTKTIGVIIANINNPFYGEMVKAIETTASNAGYTIILGNSDNDIDKEKKYIDVFLKKQVDAIIFSGGRLTNADSDENIIRASKSVPVVLTNHYVKHDNIYCILTDEAEGTALAVQHLIDKGHKAIAYINGYADSYPSIIKRENMIKALAQNRLSFDSTLEVCAASDDIKGGYDACIALLERKRNFTALFAANDLMAIGAVKALLERGYSIPEQVAVMGYDNIYLCSFITPELSSVTQNISELGVQAVKYVIKSFTKKPVKNEPLYLKPRLIIRKSC